MRVPENVKPSLHELEKTIGYKFKTLRNLYHALLHKSYVNEMPEKELIDNERLEFLGDAVLEFVTTEYLYKKYAGETEGWLTVMRSAIVERRNCAKLAREIGLDKHIFVGKGERGGQPSIRRSILANTFEAVLAAIYVDGGMQAAKKFILNTIKKYTPTVERAIHNNFKAELQNYTQKKLSVIPEYRLLSESGPDHDKIFEVGVSISGKQYGKGNGHTKKSAQQQAAQKALRKLNIKIETDLGGGP